MVLGLVRLSTLSQNVEMILNRMTESEGSVVQTRQNAQSGCRMVFNI